MTQVSLRIVSMCNQYWQSIGPSFSLYVFEIQCTFNTQTLWCGQTTFPGGWWTVPGRRARCPYLWGGDGVHFPEEPGTWQHSSAITIVTVAITLPLGGFYWQSKWYQLLWAVGRRVLQWPRAAGLPMRPFPDSCSQAMAKTLPLLMNQETPGGGWWRHLHWSTQLAGSWGGKPVWLFLGFLKLA